MDLPERRKRPAGENARGAEDDGPAYLHHADGTWFLVGPDGWPVSPEDYLAELDAGTYAPSSAELLTAVLDGLATVDVEPLSVRDTEQ